MGKARDGATAIWEREVLIIFCDLCAKEVELGNRPSRRDVEFDFLDQDQSYVPPEAYEVRVGQTFQEVIQDAVPSEPQDGVGADEMRMLRDQIAAALVNE